MSSPGLDRSVPTSLGRPVRIVELVSVGAGSGGADLFLASTPMVAGWKTWRAAIMLVRYQGGRPPRSVVQLFPSTEGGLSPRRRTVQKRAGLGTKGRR